MVFHLVHVPAPAHRKDETAAREPVEARDHLGGDDRVALGQECDAGAELEFLRRRRGERQRDERIVGVRVALGQLAAARERRAPADRDVGVFAYEQGLEAARLERSRQLTGFDPVVGRKVEDAYVHRFSSLRFGTGYPAPAPAAAGLLLCLYATRQSAEIPPPILRAARPRA